MENTITIGRRVIINRQKIIVRTSIIGIIANLALAAFKAAVGLLANSISVTLDAVNNLSDALSSVITIIGAKLSVKPADKKHPLGYGRIEYLSSMIIALIILYAGISAAIESVKKIITPETPDYSATSLIIIAVAVVVKIVLGTYVSRVGKKVNSDSLAASGKDALMDSIISASVLVAAVIYLIWGVSLEAYLGVVISLFIIKTGLEILRETISQILGERIDSEVSRQIKEELCTYDGVSGAYDLILHSYGPDQRRMTAEIYQKHNVALTGISIYSVDLSDPETDALFHQVHDEVMADENILQIHGFTLDKRLRDVDAFLFHGTILCTTCYFQVSCTPTSRTVYRIMAQPKHININAYVDSITARYGSIFDSKPGSYQWMSPAEAVMLITPDGVDPTLVIIDAQGYALFKEERDAYKLR